MEGKLYDCIVVGAGLSGLCAAYELKKAGLSYLVLEARNRVGGKTFSVTPFNDDRVVDVGAAWINDTNQSEVYALARDLNLELVAQNTSGSVIQEDIDGGLSTFEYGAAPEALSEQNGVDEMLRIRQLFEDACQQIDIRESKAVHSSSDQVSLAGWISSQSSSKTALASASVWTRAMLGLEPSEVSALHFLNYCKSGGGLLQMRKDTKDGGQYLRFVKGTQSLSKGLATRLGQDSVVLSSPVAEIQQTNDSTGQSNTIGVVTSTLPVRNYTCRKVIVTVPTPLYQDIRFHPPLPEAKAALSRTTIQGYTNKIMLLYSKPWWRAAGLCGLLQSFTGPITVTRDSSVDSVSQFSLTCFLVGEAGRRLSLKPKAERFEAIKDHVKRVFEPFCSAANVAIEEAIAVTEYEWVNDEYSKGCPVPCMPPGTMIKYESQLRTAFGDIHFAGTETSYEWKGYMDGAVRSGSRAAREVIDTLTADPAK